MNYFQIIGLSIFAVVAFVLFFGMFVKKFGEAGYFIFLILVGTLMLIIGFFK